MADEGDAVALAGEHEYVSTACQHDLHGRCRKTCKFCAASCRCPCHDGEVFTAEPLTDAVPPACGALAEEKLARKRAEDEVDRLRAILKEVGE